MRLSMQPEQKIGYDAPWLLPSQEIIQPYDGMGVEQYIIIFEKMLDLYNTRSPEILAMESQMGINLKQWIKTELKKAREAKRINVLSYVVHYKKDGLVYTQWQVAELIVKNRKKRR